MPENTHASLNHHNGAFMARLAADKYKPRTVKTYRVLLNRLVSLIAPARISPAAITMAQPADLARRDERKRREYNKYPNITGRFLAHLIDSSVAAAPIATPEQIARELLRVDYEDIWHGREGYPFPIFSDGSSRPNQAVLKASCAWQLWTEPVIRRGREDNRRSRDPCHRARGNWS